MLEEYLILLIFLIFALFLTIIIVGASYYFARQNPEIEKVSTYECGFEPFEDSRHTFEVKFFLGAILFILFDIEIMFIIPWAISLENFDFASFWFMIDFLFELSIGLFYVWCKKALDWS